tara:strand:- start:408 stop:1544 length:1137 start_codon:yes stop_codon:yes gene_type:complete
MAADIDSFEKSMEDFVQNLPLAKIGLQYLKRATNNNILSKITNIGKGQYTGSGGRRTGIMHGEFQDPSLDPEYTLTSKNAEAALDVDSPSFKLSVALDDPDKRVWASHELSHLGMALLRKSGLIDNRMYSEYEKALEDPFKSRTSKAHLQIHGGEQRALELQGRPFEGESKVRFPNRKGELEVFELPSLDLINDLANTWLEKNANDPNNKSLNYGNALEEEQSYLRPKEQKEWWGRYKGVQQRLNTEQEEFRKLWKEAAEEKSAAEETDTGYAKGGPVVALNKQTEMAFGDEPPRVDPISGNEVPPGAMPQEVRDDIPAQLSEGEYVVPADVLQYYGIKFFEDLRRNAKQDLATLESGGRIGGESIEMEMTYLSQMKN